MVNLSRLTLLNKTSLKNMSLSLFLLLFSSSSAIAKVEKVGNLKYRGVVYDVGLKFTVNQPSSVEPFNEELVKYDINTIAKKMHANAIRIEGEDINRLIIATRLAHKAGLTVLFNPWKMNVPVNDLTSYYSEAAYAAEKLRKEGVDIIFVAGCELSFFNEGIFPGKTTNDRIQWLSSLGDKKEKGEVEEILNIKSKVLNSNLKDITQAVRSNFHGKITYSSGVWENIDWDLFDIVGIDYYRYGESAEDYIKGIDKFRLGKPIIVMEVGSTAYKGAAVKGSYGHALLEGINPDGTGRFTNNIIPVRSEQEQAGYIEEQLKLLSNAQIEGVFVFSFSFPKYPLGVEARDLDMMSYSLVKTFPKNDKRSENIPPWAPKESFYKVAELYKNLVK